MEQSAILKARFNDTKLKARPGDKEIIDYILAGENTWYELLMRRNNQLLYRVIRSYLKEEKDVEDAMQDTYILAFEKLQQFRGNAEFSTWLVRIGINVALQQIRKQKTSKIYHLQEQEGQENLMNHIPSEMNPELKVIQHETHVLLEQAIDALPPKYKAVFLLRQVEQKSIAEVSECLSISETNVKVRFHRAKAMLQEYLTRSEHFTEVFEFGNSRCDDLVRRVMDLIPGHS